jgi:hypothetical protein
MVRASPLACGGDFLLRRQYEQQHDSGIEFDDR